MPVEVACPSCSHRLKAPRRYRGKQVKCPNCANTLVVPGERPRSFFHFAPTPWAAASASPEPLMAPAPAEGAPPIQEASPPRIQTFAPRPRGPWHLRILRAYIVLSILLGLLSGFGAVVALIVGVIRLLVHSEEGAPTAAASFSQCFFLLGAGGFCFVVAALIRLLLGAARDLRVLRRQARQK